MLSIPGPGACDGALHGHVPPHLIQDGAGTCGRDGSELTGLASGMKTIACSRLHIFRHAVGNKIGLPTPPPKEGAPMGRHSGVAKWTDKCGQHGGYPIVGSPPVPRTFGSDFRTGWWAHGAPPRHSPRHAHNPTDTTTPAHLNSVRVVACVTISACTWGPLRSRPQHATQGNAEVMARVCL